LNMKKEIKYKNAPKSIADGIAESVIIEDFLPAPNQLIFKEETAKITLNLNKRSIAFFKGKAKEIGIPYQMMIKKVIDLYAKKYQNI